MRALVFFVLVLLYHCHVFFIQSDDDEFSSSAPVPTPWPLRFHSLLVINGTGSLQVIDLWYDWSRGFNLNKIQKQMKDDDILYDLEWNNGTSFYYTHKNCAVIRFPVGILRPNWLDGADYLGIREIDGFSCNVWEKADFLWYYEDVVSKKPISWEFYTGRVAHVMTFEVGAVLDDEMLQAPSYCFTVDHNNMLFQQPM